MIIESHPQNYNGYPFITLMQFNEQHILTIIDNYDHKSIKAYVLDYCEAEEVDEISIIMAADYWYGNGSPTYPISIEFSKRKLVPFASKIYRTFAIDSVTRIIGPVFSYEMDAVYKIRRKRRISPNNIITIRPA